jgi:hypothetical protein
MKTPSKKKKKIKHMKKSKQKNKYVQITIFDILGESK